MAKMKKMKKAVFALPSLVTLCSVFCAFLSMAWSLQAQGLTGDARYDMIFKAALAVIFSIVFDTFDGKVARATHTSTKFGMELDSLADATSFGVAPAVLLYGFALSDCGWFGIVAAFLFAAGSILRLARFNVEAPEEGVQVYFKGMPAPGGAACVAAVVMAAIRTNFVTFDSFKSHTLGFLAITIGLLMISTLKFKTFKGEKTKADYIYVALGLSLFIALCFIYHPTIAFFFLICYYVTYAILYTMVWNLKHMKPRRRRRRKSLESSSELPAVQPVDSTDSDEKPADTKEDDAKETTADTKENASSDVSKDEDKSADNADSADNKADR